MRHWKRWVGAVIALPIVLTALFLLSAGIGSSIPRNGDWVEPNDGVQIMVGDNGIHTEIVMPLVTPEKDWRADFPASDLADPSRPYTHVALSWGEREVFLNTPSWADLKLSTAFVAAIGGEPLIHAAHYVNPAPQDDNRPVWVTHAQYARLVSTIEKQLPPREVRQTYPGYDSYDAFYDAHGSYHLGKTCNQWTSDTLAAAGIETGTWTPLAGGVMKWVPHLPQGET